MKTRYLAILIALILIIPHNLKAGEFDVEFSGGPALLVGDTTFKESNLGYQIGVNFSYFITRHISISSGIHYVESQLKTSSNNRDITLTSNAEILTVAYIDMPTVIRYHFNVGRRSRLHVGAGGYYTLGNATFYKKEYASVQTEVEHPGYDETDYGVILVGGYELNTFRHNHLTFNLEYKIGMASHKPSRALLALNPNQKDLKYSSLNFRVGHTF